MNKHPLAFLQAWHSSPPTPQLLKICKDIFSLNLSRRKRTDSTQSSWLIKKNSTTTSFFCMTLMSGSELHNCILTFSKPDQVKGFYSQMKNRGTEETNGELRSWWWAPRPCHPPCPTLGKFVAIFGFRFLMYFLAHYKASLKLCRAYVGIIKTMMNLLQKWCNDAIWHVTIIWLLHCTEGNKNGWENIKGYKRPLFVSHELSKISQERKGWGTSPCAPEVSTTCSSCSRYWMGQQLNSEALMTFD